MIKTVNKILKNVPGIPAQIMFVCMKPFEFMGVVVIQDGDAWHDRPLAVVDLLY